MAKNPRKKTAKKTENHKSLDPGLPVFQLKITLEDIEPPIWRRIQTHDCSLAELHEIIQFCMDWDDDHLHAFEIGEEQYADLSHGAALNDCGDSQSVRLSDLVGQETYRFIYEYDFGDSWRHIIEIEDTLLPEEHVRYPRCLDGRHAGPPEDCGGPWRYPDFVEALQNLDHPEHEEQLEWIGEFDPEAFDLDEVNEGLERLRRWLGRQPAHGQTARFAEGDRVRVKRGVVHRQYPDLPLGGWVGTVARIAWLIPLSYEIQWTPETLAAAHPVYAKRRRRDHEKPDVYWPDEDEIELDSAEQPAEMEQPGELVRRPLSADDEEDRIRMVFGLTSDDPLPEVNEATEQQYRDYLKAHLTFPFHADYLYDLTLPFGAHKPVTVVGPTAESPIDPAAGILCEVRDEEKTEQAPLLRLHWDEGSPNDQYVDDYRTWRLELQDFNASDEDDEEYDGEHDGEYDEDVGEEEDVAWDDNVVDDFDDEEDDPAPLADFDNGPQPFRKAQPSVGRNDLCPCGSGKKFKKCCLKKQGGGAL